MVRTHIDYKVKQGKLLRIDADIEGGVIREIYIHGDFFLHPEAGIGWLEEAALGKIVGSQELRQAVQAAAARLTMVGVSAEDILMCIEGMARQ